MELGVDISELNAVNLRNVPPTPANYAQRSGRADRSGQPALVFAYCSIGSSHDQYFFKRPERMVAGAVSPPRLDLANEDLVRAHVQAIWLTETGQSLGRSLKDVLDVDSEEPSLDLREWVHDSFADAGARRRARQRTGRVLASVEEELRDAPWYTEGWLEEVLDGVERVFDASCDRWRTLYRAALAQRVTQNKIIGDASRSQRDKDQARRLGREADGVTFSDFYSYRYFASEGFLPGYSFPRLPISAFVPGSGRRHAPRAREDCEAACYDCLMTYTNQMDHPILDRQSIHNLLMQLTGATVEASPTLGTRSEHLQQLERQAGSTLEKKWLALIEDHGYRLPSHAQRLFAEAGTRPDFFYDGDYGAAIYIDGPHHDYPERQNRDAAKTEAMEDLGYMVIRFGHQDDWNEMINQYPYIFGSEV